jgi:D-alanine-D-alanine ligase
MRPFEEPFIPSDQPGWESLTVFLCDPPIRAKYTTLFLSLHGGASEDGTLQAQLEELHYAFTGSGSDASARAFNKARAKEYVRAQQVRTADSLVLSLDDPAFGSRIHESVEQWQRVVLKPRDSGSSDGLAIIRAMNEVVPALELLARRQPEPYIIEQYLSGRELTVGVIEQADGSMTILPPSEIEITENATFDYAGKYLGKGSREITPAVLTPAQTEAVQDLARRAHQALGCRGYSRTDIILTSNGPYFLETNTLPGLTTASFIPQQLAAAGIAFGDFLEEQCRLSRKQR